MLSIHRSRRGLARIFAVAALVAVGHAHAASTGQTSLLRVTGDDGGTGFGDYVSDAGALNSFYRFYVEVPSGVSSLQIDIFDADVGAAGQADDDGNRDRLRNAFNTTIAYRLRDPAGNFVATNYTQGTNTQPANSDNTWTNFFTRANPAAGHWLIEIDAGNGDDVNAFGLRAHDGDSTAGGTELNIYADNAFQIGINPVDGTGSRTSLFTYYPYYTHGCDFDANDFDFDSGGALTVGGQGQAEVFTNRPGLFSVTYANATLSDNDDWNAETVTDANSLTTASPSGNEQTRDGYGLWTGTWRINEVTGDNANFSTLYVGPGELLAAPAPTANPQANGNRIYFPTDGGTKPLKPYVVQYYAYNSGAQPPANNANTFFDVSVVVVNPTPRAITFSGTSIANDNVLSTFVGSDGNGAAVYVGGSATVDQGTIVSTPATAGNFAEGLIVWNPTTVGANDAAVLRFQVRVTPTGGNNSTIRRFDGQGTSTASNNTHGTRARFVDETGNTTQTQATYTVNGLCGLSYQRGTNAPVPVTLSYVKGTRTGGSLAVEWSTATENANGAFDVWGRRADGTWSKLTTQPVLSKAADTVERQDYAVTVPAPADVTHFAIEDIALNGARQRHDAIAVDTTQGARSDARIDWNRVAQPATMPASQSGGSDVVYLESAQRGIHRISVAALAAAGQDLSAAPTASIALVAPDGPVPVRIMGAAGATLGAGAILEFVGTPRDSLYGTANRYRVVIDPASARRPQVSALSPEQAVRVRDRYRDESALERDRFYSLGALGADPWYDTLAIANAGAPASYDFDIDVAAAAGLDNATVAIALEGETEWPEPNDHHLSVAVNGATMGDYSFDGRTSDSLRFSLPPGTLHPGTNRVTLTLLADQGVAFDRVRVERVALDFERGTIAIDGRFAGNLGADGDVVPPSADALLRDDFDDAPAGCATNGCTRLTVAGISGEGTAWLHDRGESTLLIGTSTASGLSLVLPRDTGELFAAQVDRVHVPALIAGEHPVGDVPTGTDFLVITNPAFTGSLGSFLTARQAEGLDVVVATTDSIYARYSAGLADPAALKQFIADSHARGVAYALLVGGDTYDYGNHVSAAVSFLPTMYTWTDAEVRYAPTDALFGDVDGDGLPEVAIGRWPVRTTAQLDAIVAKTLAYASAPHAAKAVFAADNPEGVQFTTLSGYVADAMSSTGWTVDRVDVATANASAERATLLAAINDGRALTHFVGHAGVTQWTFEPLLGGQTPFANALTNATSPTVVAQWGCYSSYFVSPIADSMAHQFLFDADGGAAAVIGSGTRIRNSDTDDTLRAFMLGIGTGSERLGDAIDAMRRLTAENSAERRDLVYGVNLLGDPTLKLRR